MFQKVIAGVSLACVLCACRTSERVGSVEAPVTILAPTESTPSVVASGAGTLAMGFIDVSHGSQMGWAFSPNNGGSWQTHNAGAGLAPPNGQCGVAGWMGQPSLVSDGNGNVFYATLSDTDCNPGNGAERVTLAISEDGGSTYKSAVFVNDDPGCNNGIQDQPSITLDKSSVVIVWRHNGAGTFGGCIRRIAFTTSPLALSFSLGDSHSISNMDREGSTPGQGGLLVQAKGDGTGVVTVVYSNNDQFTGCPSASVSNVAWGSVTSYDGGASWTDHTRLMRSTQFQGCLIRSGVQINNVDRAFGFVRSPFDGHEYVAIHDSSNTVRLFVSSDDGISWREFCDGSLAHPTWSVPGYGTGGGPGCATAFIHGGDTSGNGFVYLPTLTANLRSGIALTRYESVPSVSNRVRVVFQGNSHPMDAATYDWQPSPTTTTMVRDNITLPSTGSSFLLGNFMGMAAISPDACTYGATTFVPAWTESNRALAQTIANGSVILNP